MLFTWGEIYSLFPAAMADFFGIKNSGSNYAFIYSSKGVASILAGGLAALLFEKLGSWTVVFYGSAALALITAIMAAVLIAVPHPTKLNGSGNRGAREDHGTVGIRPRLALFFTHKECARSSGGSLLWLSCKARAETWRPGFFHPGAFLVR